LEVVLGIGGLLVAWVFNPCGGDTNFGKDGFSEFLCRLHGLKTRATTGFVGFPMERSPTFSLASRIRSMKYALRGIRLVLASQHNAWIHLAATVVACAAGFFLHLSAGEWCWIVIAIIAVWTAEALNTAVEFLCDAICGEYHPLIEKAKDVSAGAVLFSAIGSVIIGTLIFVPHILQWIHRK
jgi:diacylglycerol kinase (ATP)